MPFNALHVASLSIDSTHLSSTLLQRYLVFFCNIKRQCSSRLWITDGLHIQVSGIQDNLFRV